MQLRDAAKGAQRTFLLKSQKELHFLPAARQPNKTRLRRWIKKGSIVQEPQKGHADATLTGGPPAQYDHTSMLATVTIAIEV